MSLSIRDGSGVAKTLATTLAGSEHVPIHTHATDDPLVLAIKGAKVLSVTPTLDTSVYASGDVLFVATEITNAAADLGGAIALHSLVVIDRDDVGLGLDLLFFESTVALGTINAVPSISDEDASLLRGKISINADDFVDLGGVRFASLPSLGLVINAAAGSRSIFVAAIARGAGTYSANGLRLRLGTL